MENALVAVHAERGPDRGARRPAGMARRREYRDYLREEQRRQPGCPVRSRLEIPVAFGPVIVGTFCVFSVMYVSALVATAFTLQGLMHERLVASGARIETGRRRERHAKIDLLPKCGPVAQLGARMNGIHEVTGSTPVWSTILRSPCGRASDGRPPFIIHQGGFPMQRAPSTREGCPP